MRGIGAGAAGERRPRFFELSQRLVVETHKPNAFVFQKSARRRRRDDAIGHRLAGGDQVWVGVCQRRALGWYVERYDALAYERLNPSALEPR